MKHAKLPICPGECSRRALLQGVGVAAAAAMLPACGQSGSDLPPATTTMCGSNICIDLTDPRNQALATPGGALLVDTSGDTIMVIRMSVTDVIALSAICTHSGCSMNFLPSQQLLDCPCHGSQFAEDGSVVRGPARRPLKVYVASLESATHAITITP
jgi:Rieske Fe-S protein